MGKVFYEVGKHFLSIGLAIIAFVLTGRIFIWLLLLVLGATLIFIGGKRDE